MVALRSWLARCWMGIRNRVWPAGEDARRLEGQKGRSSGGSEEAGLEDSVVRRLKLEAAGQRREPSPYLHGKIMGAVRRSTAPAARRRFGAAGWALGLATGCVLLAVLVVMQTRPPRVEESGAPEVVLVRTPFPLPSGSAPDLAIINGERLERWGRSFDQPLQNEIQYVLNDARGVLENLAQNFLPSKLRESALSGMAN